MTLYPEFEGLTLEQLIGRFHGPPADGSEYAAVYFDDVALRIVQQGPPGVEFLLHEWDTNAPDEDHLSGILLALSFPGLSDPATVGDRFRTSLNDHRPMVLVAAIDGMVELGLTDVHDRVVAMADYPSPYVRGSVLRYLARLFPAEAHPLLLNALHDEYFVVRESAVDELADLGDASVLPALQPLLADSHPDVREATRSAVEQLSDVQQGSG